MPRKEATSKFRESLELNTETYNDYYTRFMTIACSLFQWDNLPEGITERFIEKTLYERGSVAFHFDTTYGLMASRVTINGQLNFMDEATAYNVYNINYTKTKPADDVVLCRNNLFSVPTHRMINLYARRLTNLERTIDTNIELQKHPVLILCDESERLSIENLMMQVEGNIPFILGTKNLDLGDRVKVFNTGTPFLADKLQETKEVIVNELYTRMGLNNANTDKRERMIVDEVNANNEVIGINIETMFATRKLAVDQLNERFKEHLNGKEVTVSLRFKQEPEPLEEEGGDPDGEVHDDDQDAT